MANVAIILGTGPTGNDVVHKTPWIRHLIKKDHHIYVASRIDKSILSWKELEALFGSRAFEHMALLFNELYNICDKYSFVYGAEVIQKHYSEKEINSAERFLRIPFNYISSMDRRFFDRDRLTDSRDRRPLRNFMCGLVHFFKKFFLDNNTHFLVNTLEDDIFSTVGYFVAKRLNIPVIGLVSGRFPRSGLMLNKDFTKLCEWTSADVSWSDIVKLYSQSDIAGKQTLKRNRERWQPASFLDSAKCLKNVKNRASFEAKLIKHFPAEKFILERKSYFDEIKEYSVKFVRRYMNSFVACMPDYKKNYFFFPLHFTDDAQITFREPLLDQFQLLSKISRSLPSGYYLYIKPHPHYFGTDVKFKALYEISQFHNVKIINPEISPSKLINNSAGVITINSTTGFEALIYNKPVVTFGHDFYCKPNLAYVVRDLNNLPGIFMDIVEQNQKFDRKVIEEFVKKVYANTIWLDGVEHKTAAILSLSDDDGRRIAYALDKIIENMQT